MIFCGSVLLFSSCEASNSAWQSSEPLHSHTISELPLVKVSEMKGYDADSRPSAAARVEQQFECIFSRDSLSFGGSPICQC